MNHKDFQIKNWKSSQENESLIIEGWVSTDDLDSYNDIVEPTAFAPVIDKYLKKPIVLWMHQFYDLAIGKTLSLEIIDTPRNEEPYGSKRGLWGKIEIAGTTTGKDVQILLDMGAVNSFSYWYEIAEDGATVTTLNGETIRHITKFSALHEISVCNLGADWDAIIKVVKSKNLNLKSLNVSPEGRENKEHKEVHVSLNKEEVKSVVSESLDPLSKDMETVQVTVDDLKGQIGKLTEFKKEMLEVKDRNKSEIDEKVARMEEDFKKALDEFNVEFNKAKQAKLGNIGIAGGLPKDLKALVMEPTPRLKSLLPSDRFGMIKEFQKKHDDLLLVDATLEASSRKFGPIDGLGEYHNHPRHQRIKNLNIYKEFDEFRKAMDSTTASEGDEWVPTGMSRDIIELVDVQLKVADLFDSFTMPTSPFDIPAEGADTEAVIASETTAVTAARADTTEQTPGTGKVTFTAEKLRGRYQISRELTEDSAVAIIPFARKKIAKSMARAEEQAIINGQETADIDTGYGGISSTSAKKICDGLRYHTQSNAQIDLSTFNEDGLRNMRAVMTEGGPYGLYPEDIAFICSAKGYLKHFLKDLDSVLTVDKYGPNAVVLKGELMKFDNIPVIPSGFVQDDLNASGIYDATTTDKTIVLLVYRDGFRRGIRRDIEIMTEYNMFHDIYDIVAFKRWDFQPVYTVASNYITAYGYGVTT